MFHLVEELIVGLNSIG